MQQYQSILAAIAALLSALIFYLRNNAGINRGSINPSPGFPPPISSPITIPSFPPSPFPSIIPPSLNPIIPPSLTPSPITPPSLTPSPIMPPSLTPSPIMPPSLTPSPITPAPPINNNTTRQCGSTFSYQPYDETATPFVVGGSYARLGQFPWMANLNGCGGALIHPQWVLTAAHCMPRRGMRIGLGQLNRFTQEPSAQFVTAAAIYSHPGYREGFGYPNDIALIKLSQPAKLNNYVNVGCIGNVATAGRQLVISGWGNTRPPKNPGSPSAVLKYAVLQEVTRCKFGVNAARQICAQGTSFSCFGDSGGPLHANVGGKYYVVGAVSFGDIPCSQTAVYTRVSYYLPWIRQYVPGV